MSVDVINVKRKADLITELHSYKRVATLNDIDFKLVKAHREFVWHKHPDTDEVFIGVEGTFEIHLRDKLLTIGPGDLVSIPKNVEHKPVCKEQCTIMLIEPGGTVNTGDAGGNLTDTDLEDI
jgi:mannose-6-phosphate isomerase-like protein (cupin superfamily)